MYKNITIGEANIPMLSTAATNIYYKQIFREDPLAIQTADATEAEGIVLAQRLAFVMAKQAEGQKAVNEGKAAKIRDYMQTINPDDDYIDWMDTLDFGELNDALPDVMSLYMAQQKTGSKSKNA